MTSDALALPTRDADWYDFVAERAETWLARARATVATLTDGTDRTADEVIALWNQCDVAVANASTHAELFAAVHPEERVRERAEVATQEVAAFLTERGQDRALYEVVAAVDTTGLDAQATRLVEKVLRDFQRSGVDRDDATRARLTEIAERMVVVGQEFSRTIREDVRSIRVTAEQLAGLPQDWIEAHPADEDGLVTVTTDYPDLIPYLSFAEDRGCRIALATANGQRGWPANDAVLAELLQLRHEQAVLLGHDGWPDFDAEVKMIGTGAAIGEFIDRVADLASASAERDLATLLARAQADDPAITAITSGDTAHYTELIRREQFDVDAQQVRTYFDFTRVRDGLLTVTGRLFDVSYEQVDAPAWHPDVTSYDVVRDGVRLGRIHLDLHPRDGKYKHAAQFDLVTGVSGTQLPEGALVCNFSRQLMEHSNVVTLFHEFGHLVHHVLGGDQQFARFSGVATEWDFVEAPSQLLEEWAWDADILRSFAQNAAGEAIPADLVARMRQGKDVAAALSVRTQMYYAAISYWLHRDRPTDQDAAVTALRERYSLVEALPDTHFHTAFGHLEGYSSGYYTYMWSQVISRDLFSAFDPEDLFNTEVAGRYRDRVLAPGGSADAADLVADFLGRPYSFDAFATWLNSL